MGADSRVDLLLALRTTLQGNNEAIAYLDKFEAAGKRSATGVAAEFDKLGGFINSKLSAFDVGKSFLTGLGLGSGFAVLNQAMDRWAAIFREVEENAKAVADYVDHIHEKASALAQLRLENFLGKQAPAEQVATLRSQLDQLDARIAASAKRKAELDRDLQAAAGAPRGTIAGTAFDPLGGKYGSLKFMKTVGDEIDALQRKEEDKLDDLAQQRERLLKSIEAAEKSVLEAKKKEVEIAQKADEQIDDEINKRAIAAAQFEEDIRAKNAERAKEYIAAAKKQELDEAATAAIRKAQDAVQDYDAALKRLEANPYLSDQEKQAERLRLLDKETEAIKAQKKALDEFATAHPGVDVGGLTAARARLDDKATDVATEKYKTENRPTLASQDALAAKRMSDPAFHYQSAGEGLTGGLVGYFTQLGTMADQLAAGIDRTLGAAVSGITNEILKWDGTGKGALRALGNVGILVFNTLLQELVQMGVQMTLNELLFKSGMLSIDTLGEGLRAKRMAATAAEGAENAAANAPGAVAAGISSWGVALAFGALALAAIMAASGGFATGGFTSPLNGPGAPGEIAGVVHKKEWVAPAWMTQSAEYGPVIAGLEAARMGKPGYNWGGWANSFGGPLFEPLRDYVFGLNRPTMVSQKWDAAAQAWGPPGSADYVAPSEAIAAGVSRPEYASLASSSFAEGAGGSVGRAAQVVYVDYRNHNALEQLERDPRFRTVVVKIMNDNRRALSVKL